MNLNRKRNVHLTTGSVGPRAWRRSHGPRGRDRPQRGHARLHRWFVQSTYGPRWLPERWCQPLAIYMAPILLQTGLQLGAALAMAQLVRAHAGVRLPRPSGVPDDAVCLAVVRRRAWTGVGNHRLFASLRVCPVTMDGTAPEHLGRDHWRHPFCRGEPAHRDDAEPRDSGRTRGA